MTIDDFLGLYDSINCTPETYVDKILVNVTGSLCTFIIPASESQCSRKIGMPPTTNDPRLRRTPRSGQLEKTIVPRARVIAARSLESLLMIAFVPEDRREIPLDTSIPGIEYTTVLHLAQTYVGVPMTSRTLTRTCHAP